MKRNSSIAVLQIIPHHHELLPVNLIKALAMLDDLGQPYSFYDIKRSQEYDFRVALIKLLVSIKEETVLVSMACNNNYPKIESLIFLYLYLPLLKNKKIVICSPYFTLYETSLIKRDNVIFSLLDIDDYVTKHIGTTELDENTFINRLGNLLPKYGYDEYRFWSYLTFGCHAKCSFCYNRLPYKEAPTMTRRSPETVLKWMEEGKRLGKTYFEFCEPNFLTDRPFAQEFLKRLKKENPGITWRCKTRLDDIDPDIYGQMIAAGCRTIFFGVEHVDVTLLQHICKCEDSAKKLQEFLTYRKKETTVDLSFMSGIRGESPEAIRRNLDMITHVGTLINVEPNLGWQIIFDRKKKNKTYPNFIVTFMYITNIIPHRWGVSPALMQDVLRLSIREPFFDFLYLTESEASLELMQQLVIYIKSNPQKQLIRDYHRLLNYEDGMLTKFILKNRTLKALNDEVLSSVVGCC